jgi:hypothetical protein
MNQLTTDIRAFCITTSFFLISEFRVNELSEAGLSFSAKRTAYWSDMTRRRDVHIFSQSLLKKGICLPVFPTVIDVFLPFRIQFRDPSFHRSKSALSIRSQKWDGLCVGGGCSDVMGVLESLLLCPLPVSVVQDLAPFVDLDLCQKNALFQTCRPLSSFLAIK